MADENKQEELLEAQPEAKEAAPKAKKEIKKPKFNKKQKQETFKTKSGEEVIFTFPGTLAAEQMQNQAKGSGSVVILSNLHELYMREIFEGMEYDWDYYDSKIPKADREMTQAFKDVDDKKVTYKFKLPSLERIEDIAQVTDDGTNGERLASELMDDIITVKDGNKYEKVDWDYWDEHLHYADVMAQAWVYCYGIYRSSEYAEVMEACTEFVNKLFR